MYDKIKQSTAKLQTLFTNAGFKEVKKLTEDIVAATNKNEVAEKALNEELQKRVQNLRAAEKE
jgi:hypothetical protein